MRIGTRCAVCTGCGRCFGEPGAERKIDVLGADGRGGGDVFAPGFPLIAADIGTTTIALARVDADGKTVNTSASINPQIPFGADVLSRIRAAEDPEAARAMRDTVRDVLRRGAAELEKTARKISGHGDYAWEEEAAPDVGEPLPLYISANTTMRYLLLGEDPEELGRAPFAASHLAEAACEMGEGTDAEEGGRGWADPKRVPATVLPGFSAFVGGDIYAGALACGMCEVDELTLLIDLGTNGELLLGNRSGLLGCATAAGPAFEGGPNRGIWGADMVHLTAELLRRGLLDETGLLADAYFDTGIRIGDVLVTQQSIRAIQLAKGAIAAGTEILLREWSAERAEAAPRVARVVLAGGFGYYLKPADAARIGLLPEELAGRAAAGGNTALAGAVRYAAGERICAPVRILNLAEHPDFEQRYLASLNFPAEGV